LALFQKDIGGIMPRIVIVAPIVLAIEAAKVSFVRDDAIRGFALRIFWSGRRSFIKEGRIGGRVRRVTIGRYPDLSAAAAR